MRTRSIAVAALALAGVACNALFGESAQCNTDADCAGFGADQICGSEGTCVARGGAIGPTSTGDGGGVTTGSDAGVDAAPAAGPLAKIVVTPDTATVTAGSSQTFSAIGIDGVGRQVSPPPMYAWSVSGGGTIDMGGKFTAGATPGGPFTVTVTSGAVSATAKVTVGVAPPQTIKIGETSVLNNDDSGNQDILLAQQATLGQQAKLESLSFYIAQAAGNLRLGLYDDSGPNGGPGAKKAETDEVAAVQGWMTVPVVTQVTLPAGNYWLAYAPSSNDLHFRLSDADDGKLAYYNQTYGPLPDTFSTTPTTDTKHWSFYASLTK